MVVAEARAKLDRFARAVAGEVRDVPLSSRSITTLETVTRIERRGLLRRPVEVIDPPALVTRTVEPGGWCIAGRVEQETESFSVSKINGEWRRFAVTDVHEVGELGLLPDETLRTAAWTQTVQMWRAVGGRWSPSSSRRRRPPTTRC